MNQTHCKAFIVGMPRAGTTYISKLLNRHPEIVSVGESLYWGRHFIDPQNDGLYTSVELREILDRFLGWNWEPKQAISDRSRFEEVLKSSFDTIKTPCSPEIPFEALAKTFSEVNQKLWFIEKTPHHINWLNRIVSYYPNSKFIIAVREPYSFMLSYKYQGLQTSKEVREVFKKLYHPISCAVVWRKNYRSIQNSQNNPLIETFVFEQTKLNDLNQLRRLESFLELESGSLSTIKKYNSSFDKNDQSYSLTSVDIFWMNVIAKKEIKSSEYVYRSVKPNLFFLLQSILIFPYKVLVGFYLLSKNSNRNLFSYIISYIRK